MDQVQSKDSLQFNTSIKISYLLPDERIIIMRILLEKDGPHIAIITIDHQKKLNAMSREMMQRLGNIWDELSRDETRCIILTGAGERAFCAGADISGDLEATPEISKIVNHALLKTDIFKISSAILITIIFDNIFLFIVDIIINPFGLMIFDNKLQKYAIFCTCSNNSNAITTSNFLLFFIIFSILEC